MITPSPEGEGFLEDACARATTLPSTGAIHAVQLDAGGSPSRPCSHGSAGGSLFRVRRRPLAPTGLDARRARADAISPPCTGQATKASDIPRAYRGRSR